MPELPEMQALAERLETFVVGRALRKVDLLGFSSLKTFSPRVEDLYGQVLQSITRRAKYLVWTFGDGTRIVVHLSQAGRVDVESPPKKTRPRGSVARFVFSAGHAEAAGVPADAEDPEDGVERAILVREHGTQRKASWWVLAPGDDGPLDGLGPEPDSPAFAELVRTSTSARRLHSDLRDQRVVAGIGRGWGDDILHRARLSPFATMKSLRADERERLLAATTSVLAEALELERTRGGGLSEAKLGGRFAVHGRFGQPCPTPGCTDHLRRVSYESYEMTYCATCQTGGKALADRRLSRLLK
jgi:formamidopyrimidine-DNA glycosylase